MLGGGIPRLSPDNTEFVMVGDCVVEGNVGATDDVANPVGEGLDVAWLTPQMANSICRGSIRRGT